MNASELSRHLLFYGYEDVADHLKQSPLNRHLYKVFIDILPKSQIKVPILTLFNEIYYLCARVNFDGNPGLDIEQRYLAEEEKILQSKEATDLVFNIVFGLLSDKSRFTFEEACFLRALAPHLQGSDYEKLALTIPQDLKYQNISIPEVYPTLTCPIIGLSRFLRNEDDRGLMWALINAGEKESEAFAKQLRKVNEFCDSWASVTGNYSHVVIEKLLCLYEKPEDQLSLLRIIDASCTEYGSLKLSYYFTQLEKRIRKGNFEPEVIPSLEPLDYYYKEENEKILCCEEHVEQLILHPSEVITEPVEYSFKLAEMVDYVKKKFSFAGATEFTKMCYGLIIKNNKAIDEETAELLDGIDEAILQRDARQQVFNMPNIQQFNNNPQQVINQTKEEGKE